MQIVFPRLDLPPALQLKGPYRHPKEYLANPKAVAAQTFKAAAVETAFHDSQAWSHLSDLFSIQFGCDEPMPEVVGLPLAVMEWIAYPLAIVAMGFERACVVWDDGLKVRHIRLCSTEARAEEDNAAITAVIKAAIKD